MNTANAFFPRFESFRIDTGEATINGVKAGHGPPLLLLHGWPQTHVEWHRIAPALARDFTVVATDLRGYGDSSRPEDGENHAGYSKRSMAQDQVRVMRAGNGKWGLSPFSFCVGGKRGLSPFRTRAGNGDCPLFAHYRAAATTDLEHDAADLDRKLRCPVLALWGADGVIERLYDTLETWRERAENVRGKALPGGHWLPEQLPREVCDELLAFLS
jgi:pimeloyl-ACP methyl ester carboxylesterase